MRAWPSLFHRHAAPMLRAHQQRGSVAPFMALAIGGALLATAYSLDTSRMTNSAAQVKRATDAAALAIGHERLLNGSSSEAELNKLAHGYVINNLGLDSSLAAQIGEDNIALSQTRDDEGRIRYKVEVTFQTDPELLDIESRDISVYSVAEVQPSALEVALALPNTTSENSANLSVLRRQSKRFAQEMLKNRDNAWLALVPFSAVVNVSPTYTNPQTRTPRGPSAEHMQRLRQWAMGSALQPVELTSLFRSGKANSLADARIPDRRANLLCLYRGLKQGNNYFWEQPPSGQFKLYYRDDLPQNGSPGADPISWVGPNPFFGQATGSNDTRWMVADKDCPSAPLLPLSNDQNKIDERLDQMTTRFNANYAIALGWSAMALAPAFRGSNGWNLPDELPKDFKDEGGDSYKAIVMLVNTTGARWIDTDGYNFEVGENSGTLGTEYARSLVPTRFSNLCKSLRKHKLRVFVIAIGVDEIEDNDLNAEGTINGASQFRRLAGPGLAHCAEEADDITYISGYDFVAAEGRLQNRLDKILDELRQQSAYVRLIE